MRYGTVQRLWGIIIMEQAALPFRTKSLKGKGAMLYGSNGRRFVLTGQMEEPSLFSVTLPGVYRNLLEFRRPFYRELSS